MRLSKLLLLFVVFMSMISSKSFAYDIAVENADGVTIYYNYINDGKELAVSRRTGPFSAYNGIIRIPESVLFMDRNHRVTAIEEDAFSGASLSCLSIPKTIKKIEKNAFKCTIEKLIIKDIESWLEICIENTQSWKINHLYDESDVEIKDLIIPDNTDKIGNNLFSSFYGIKSVSIPNSVATIGDDAFFDCKGLTSVTVPSNVHGIGKGAFNGCSGLVSLTISEGVEKIGDYAFFDCINLPSVIIPSSVEAIGHDAFGYCNLLEELTLSDGVTKIEDYAFDSCGRLYSITIPKSVSYIGVAPFYNCI